MHSIYIYRLWPAIMGPAPFSSGCSRLAPTPATHRRNSERALSGPSIDFVSFNLSLEALNPKLQEATACKSYT